MKNGRRIISTIICCFIVTASVHAGMMPVPQQDAGRRQTKVVCDRENLYNKNLFNSYSFPRVACQSSESVSFLPRANADVGKVSEIQHLKSFTDGPGSLNLCLSALIGLGLCSSANFLKKTSFSFVPECFHNGGPFQIGHSYAVTPELLYRVPVCCFVQPVETVVDLTLRYRWRVVVSSWRKSQFTLSVIASRGPPIL